MRDKNCIYLFIYSSRVNISVSLYIYIFNIFRDCNLFYLFVVFNKLLLISNYLFLLNL